MKNPYLTADLPLCACVAATAVSDQCIFSLSPCFDQRISSPFPTIAAAHLLSQFRPASPTSPLSHFRISSPIFDRRISSPGVPISTNTSPLHFQLAHPLSQFRPATQLVRHLLSPISASPLPFTTTTSPLPFPTSMSDIYSPISASPLPFPTTAPPLLFPTTSICSLPFPATISHFWLPIFVVFPISNHPLRLQSTVPPISGHYLSFSATYFHSPPFLTTRLHCLSHFRRPTTRPGTPLQQQLHYFLSRTHGQFGNC